MDPRVEDVDILDIAHALSRICRYGGHIEHHYSVAQHSVLVSHACEDALQGLLHDASEAYLGDVISPLKAELPAYKVIERAWEQTIAARFRLAYPPPDEVKVADMRALVTERRDLIKNPELKWSCRGETFEQQIVPLEAPQAKALFLARFYELEARR
jgi:hypothetical protein